MRKQFARTLLEVGADKRLAVFIGDISHFLLRDFEDAYPDRFFNMGIAEQSMVSMAAGMAMNGFFPVVHTITPFVTERCFEQIKDDLCYQQMGVNIVAVGSAFDYASLGCTHHCYDDIAILRALPHMQLVYPASPKEFDMLFKETYANGSPTYFRLPAHTHGIATSPRFGEVEKLLDGGDVTVVVAGPQLQNAHDACMALSAQGVLCDLIYLTTIKPLSSAARQILSESLSKTGLALFVEEHSIIGGIADQVALDCSRIKYKHARLGIPDRFLTNYGSYEQHCEALGFTKAGVISAVQTLLES